MIVYVDVSWGKRCFARGSFPQFPGEPVTDQLCYYEGYKAQPGETFEQQLKRQLVEDMKDRGRKRWENMGRCGKTWRKLRKNWGKIRWMWLMWLMWLMFGSDDPWCFPWDFSMAFSIIFKELCFSSCSYSSQSLLHMEVSINSGTPKMDGL